MKFLKFVFIIFGILSGYGVVASLSSDILTKLGMQNTIAESYAIGVILFFTIAFLLHTVDNMRAEADSMQSQIAALETKTKQSAPWTMATPKRTCSNCGAQIDSDSKSCPKCGQKQ